LLDSLLQETADITKDQTKNTKLTILRLVMRLRLSFYPTTGHGSVLAEL